MKLEDIMYLTIRSDGSINYIFRNDEYYNHFQYLQDFSKQDEYLKINSFGLIFTIDDNMAKIFFLKNLVEDGTIVYENLKTLSSSDISGATIYLPDRISPAHKEVLERFESEIEQIENIFLEKYNEGIVDLECFSSITETTEDLHNGNQILKKYVNENLIKPPKGI